MKLPLVCFSIWCLIKLVIGAPPPKSGKPVQSVVNFKKLVKPEDWDKLFPNRWFTSPEWKKEYNKDQPWFYPAMNKDYYSYENFIRSIRNISKRGLEMFLNEPGTSDDDKKRELCAFLGNIGHETGKGKDGLYYREEVDFERTVTEKAGAYRDVGSRTTYKMNDKPVNFRKGSKLKGKVRFTQTSYHGRGPIQLSWGYNYGDYSKFIFNDPQKLLDNPDLLLDKPMLGIGSALWYWLAAPDRGKDKLPHYVMYKQLTEKRPWGYGPTIMAINGGLEGGATYGGSSHKDQQVTRRIDNYKRCAEILKVKVGVDGEQLDTAGL